MPLDPVVNFFRSQIATLPLASGGATMVITTGDGNKLPNPATDGAFNLVIYNANDPFVTPEIVRVTAKSGDSLTITRAQEGTTATNKTAGNTWFVELVNTAKMIQNIDTNKVEKTGDTMTGTLTATKLIPSGNVVTGNGMYLPAANTLAFSTNGAEAIRVNANQDVRIGSSGALVSGLLVSRATGTATPTPAEIRIQTTSDGGDWSNSLPWGRLSFYSSDVSFGAKIHAGIDVIAFNTVGGLSDMVFFNCDTSANRTPVLHILRNSGGNANAVHPETDNAQQLGLSNKRWSEVFAGAVTASNLVTAGKFAPTANTTAGNGMYLPTTNTVAIGTNGTEAMRIDASQRVMIGATTGTMRFNVQNKGIVGGTERDPNASGTTVSIYTITCSASSFSSRYNIANCTLYVSIGAESTSANAHAILTLPFMLRRTGRATGSVVMVQGTPVLIADSTGAGSLTISAVTVALSSASNTGGTIDITVTTGGSQTPSNLNFNSSLDVTQYSRLTPLFTITAA